jgi:putative Ig domain-containing protein/Ig-like domain-containing protein
MRRLLPVVVLVVLGVVTASLTFLHAAPPQYSGQRSVNLAPSNPQLTAVDPYANAVSTDTLKPARPFWYSVDKNGLTILRMNDNMVVYRVVWPTTTIPIVQPNGEFVDVPVPASGWEPVGMTVSYPTEEALASSSETPPTYVYVVMAHSGLEWRSNPAPPLGQDSGVRDMLVTSTTPATESSMLVQVDVTDPTFSPEAFPAGPVVAGAILGHAAGQPAYDPATGNIYVGNMPSTSLPTSPRDLTSFVSVIAPLAPPEASEVAVGPPEVGGGAALIILCGPEHPEDGLLAGVPAAWPCAVEGGDGPFAWEFVSLPGWLTAHQDKLSGQLDGILFGTPTVGTYTFQVRVTDLADPELPAISDWATVTLNVTTTAQSEASEGGFEVGVAGGQALEGTGACVLAPTFSPGSIVPNWIDVVTVPGGCVVMGTAPISGEYYEFAMPGFHFASPFNYNPVIFSGNVAGPYVFDPLPAGVGISGLAWHEIDKIHDPSTEADILNAEYFGVEPFTGQLYRILPPQGAIEGSGAAAAPPETSIEMDVITPVGTPLAWTLTTYRPDIADVLTANPSLKVKFGDLVVEANREPNLYVTASQILDPTGISPTVIPIGGPTGSSIAAGVVVKVSGTREIADPTEITMATISPIEVPGVQAYFAGLDSDLRPAIRGTEPGQVDHGVLWITGTTTGNVAVVDTVLGTNAQSLAVPNAASLGGVSVDIATRSAYVAGMSLQNVTIFGTGAASGPRAPVIWSANLATFNTGELTSFDVMATGTPTPSLSVSGALPDGVTFTDNGNGTAAMAGTPAEGTAGDYTVTITATNTEGSTSQSFILTVASLPVITTANATTFVVGSAGSFLVIATGSPVPVVWVVEPLPAWLTFTDNEDGTATLAGAPAQGSEGIYTFTIEANTGMLPDATQTFTLTVQAAAPMAPTITSPNTATFVIDSEAVTFTVTATGSPTPALSEQGALPAGVTFTDNGNSTATLTGTPAAPGSYAFTITAANGVSPAATQLFTLVVNAAPLLAPAIDAHPTNQTVIAGQSAAFRVVASGTAPLSYQWLKNGVAIAGATGASYDTPPTTAADNGARFSVIVTNPYGTATSNSATLIVTGAPVAPSITTQPASQTVTAGQTATFSVVATGTSPTYQWRRNGVTIGGATSASYTTPPTTTADSGSTFSVVVQNSIGSVLSNNATLTVNAALVAPSISTQPANQTVTAGQTATFSVVATGTAPLVYQWRRNGANIGGATAASYITPATTTADSGSTFSVVVTNPVGGVTSNNAILIVNAPAPVAPSITTQPSNQTVTAGQTATFSIVATGTAPLSYQWRRNGANIGGATSASYSTPATTTADSGSTFSVVVANSGGSVTSNSATLTVNAQNGALEIVTTSLANGTVGMPYSAQLMATGGTAPYSWSLATRQGLPPGLLISSAGQISGMPTRAGNYGFRVVVADAASQSVTERLVIVVVRAPRQ